MNSKVFHRIARRSARSIRSLYFLGNSNQTPLIPSSFRRDQVIFIHVPKGAGSTINLSLFGYRNGHRCIESFWKADPAFTEQAFKFTFVRHPYFRLVSAYRYLLKGGMSSRDEAYLQRYKSAFSSLGAFAEACEEASFRNSVIHLRPQAEFLSIPSTGHYSIFMDFVGKTELFNDHIDLLQNLLPRSAGLKLARAKNISINAGPSANHSIDKGVFRRVRSIYQDDFELFGYDEWGTVEKVEALGIRK